MDRPISYEEWAREEWGKVYSASVVETKENFIKLMVGILEGTVTIPPNSFYTSSTYVQALKERIRTLEGTHKIQAENMVHWQRQANALDAELTRRIKYIAELTGTIARQKARIGELEKVQPSTTRYHVKVGVNCWGVYKEEELIGTFPKTGEGWNDAQKFKEAKENECLKS
jgi:hypothetical protein